MSAHVGGVRVINISAAIIGRLSTKFNKQVSTSESGNELTGKGTLFKRLALPTMDSSPLETEAEKTSKELIRKR